MTLNQILEAIDELPPTDLEQTLNHIEEKIPESVPKEPPRWSSGEEWMELLEAAVKEFWGDTPPEERKAIINAINTKSIPGTDI